MTPEGKVKAKVNRALYNWDHVYKFMPVQMGFGAATLDYLISVNGYFLGIETKAPGKKPTDRQLQTMAQIVAAGGTVLVIDGDLKELNAFMGAHTVPSYHMTREQQRKRKLKNRHGITLEQYNTLLEGQGGHCYFCSRTPDQEPHGVLCV